MVVALKAEYRAAALTGLPAVCLGVGPERARRAAQALIHKGARALVSFGVAGGLRPELAPGTLLLPSELHWRGAFFHTDEKLYSWLSRIAGTCLSTVCAPHVAVDEMVMDVRAKARLASAHGAAGVDMESGGVAEAANAAAVPFAIVRSVCDDAGTSLSPRVAELLNGNGELRLLHAAAAVLRRPALMSELISLGADFKQALDTLRCMAQALRADLNTRGEDNS